MYLIIGKSGQLARELNLTSCRDDIAFVGKNDIDLQDIDNIQDLVSKRKFKAIINASAYTFVDQAENDIVNAYKMNRDAVKNLAQICKTNNLRLIHISTDYVFDGNKTVPYHTFDRVNPINVYGSSKLAGEIEINKALDSNYTIIRTSWLYSSFGKNFVKTIISKILQGHDLNLVDDQFGSPTYARGLAEFIWYLIEKDQIQKIYHWCDIGCISWYEFGKAIYQESLKMGLTKNEVNITPVSSEVFKQIANRPKYSALEPSQESKIYWKDNLIKMLGVINKSKQLEFNN